MSFLKKHFLKSDQKLLHSVLSILSCSQFDIDLEDRLRTYLFTPEKHGYFQNEYSKSNRAELKKSFNLISKMELTLSITHLFGIGVDITLLDVILDVLSDKVIIIPNFLEMKDVYQIQNGIIRYLESVEKIKAYVLGFSEIAELYEKSVFVIENTPNDPSVKIGVGTGFYQEYYIESINKKVKFILTNKHVVEGGSIRLFNSKKIELAYNKIITPQNDLDLAAIILKNDFVESNIPIPSLSINDLNLVEEIIIMGYPPVSQTNEAYLLTHKGEINAVVSTRNHSYQVLLFSARTFPGNSGGPIINELGKVVGIVSESAPFIILENGKEKILSEFFMGILSKDVIGFIDNSIIPVAHEL